MSLFATPYKKAIAYYRHSAEDKQENSVPIQREHIQKFARDNHIEVIHEEADEGETGLLASRPGFTRIFDDWILRPQAPAFDFVLVYDVSRWGRFQDQDEAAYYEFLCRKQGKRVIYVAHGFPQAEHQLIAHLQTSIERYMAAEYSRQLSDKVFHGCVKVSQAGYSAGGTACYGMGRLLLDVEKRPVRVLKRGEHKSIDNERVTFVPLNDQTTQTVKEIFRLFAEDGKTTRHIELIVDQRRIPAPNGATWNERKVVHILTNATYVGSRIYNKTSNRLKRGKRDNPLREWVVCQHAFPSVIDSAIFKQAQEKIYWQQPSQWRRGVYVARRVASALQQEIREFLMRPRQGIMVVENDDVQTPVPLLTGITLHDERGTPSWCFSLPTSLEPQHEVIGVGITLEAEPSIDRYFKIPTQDFSLGGYKFFSEKDDDYNRYLLNKDELEKVVTVLASKRS